VIGVAAGVAGFGCAAGDGAVVRVLIQKSTTPVTHSARRIQTIRRFFMRGLDISYTRSV
jgi:hypothetical protein